ncbi:MAG TPA: hypothetical protein V6D14_00165 [Coleofasciculaceae cyanobacterium]
MAIANLRYHHLFQFLEISVLNYSRKHGNNSTQLHLVVVALVRSRLP